MNDAEYKPVLINPMDVPCETKSNWWDWVRFYAYNLLRRPMVRAKQRDVNRIYRAVKRDVDLLLLPKLTRNVCMDCGKAYIILKNQQYLSMIERFLRAMPCHEHSAHYIDFWLAHRSDFEASEQLSAWINGFV